MSFILKVAKFFISNVRKYRLWGLNDFHASLISVVVLALCNVGFLAWIFKDDLLTHDVKVLVFALAVIVIIAAIATPVIVYLINLRAFGITHADSKISAGIDYKTSLERLGSGGFKFMGVSGAKLTAEDSSIRSAIQAAGRANNKIQVLIVDPGSVNALKDLEGRDAAVGYQERINGSASFLNRLAREHAHIVEVRQYHAGSIADLKPFRILFSSSDCLLSPFVQGTGVEDQGRKLPQICVSSKGWPNGRAPTFFSALDSYFKKNWDEAQTEDKRGDDAK